MTRETFGRRYFRREEDRECQQQGCGEVAPLGRAQWDWLYCCDCIRMWTVDAFVLCPAHGEAGGAPINCPDCGHAMMHP